MAAFFVLLVMFLILARITENRQLKTAAFNNSFIQHKHQLYGYIKGMVNNEDVAKDLIQELYLKLYNSRKSIKEESAQYFYFRSAKNQCIDWFRKNDNKRTVEFTYEMEAKTVESTEQNELTRHFRSLMDKLPPQQREAIYLTDVCGMNTRETMQVAGFTKNSLRANLSRARTKIKEGLAKIYQYEATTKS